VYRPATIWPKKPDLVVKSAVMTSRVYAFRDEITKISFVDTTQNIGHRSSGTSYTGIRLKAPQAYGNRTLIPVIGRRVARLDPGKSNEGRFSTTYDFSSFPLGAYVAYVCADMRHDVDESTRDNNCHRAGRLYLIKKNWTGGFSGLAPFSNLGDAHEKWESYPATFEFGARTKEPTEPGADGAAMRRRRRAGEYPIALGVLHLDYLREQYTIVGEILNPFYTITWSCLGYGPQDGPACRRFLDMKRVAPLPFGMRILKRHTHSECGSNVYGADWWWSLS
jgi:hypothetical protein